MVPSFSVTWGVLALWTLCPGDSPCALWPALGHPPTALQPHPTTHRPEFQFLRLLAHFNFFPHFSATLPPIESLFTHTSHLPTHLFIHTSLFLPTPFSPFLHGGTTTETRFYTFLHRGHTETTRRPPGDHQETTRRPPGRPPRENRFYTLLHTGDHHGDHNGDHHGDHQGRTCFTPFTGGHHGEPTLFTPYF